MLAIQEIATNAQGASWLPDVVAGLWKLLAREKGRIWRDAYDQGMGAPSEENLVDFLGADGLMWRQEAHQGGGWIPPPIMALFLSKEGPPRESDYLKLLVALDFACKGFNLIAPKMVPAFEELRVWACGNSRGNLAHKADCLVLRRGAEERPGGASLRHYLRNLVVIDPQTEGDYTITRVETDVWCPLKDRPGQAAKTLTLAFVPLLNSLDDVTFHKGSKGTPAKFSLTLDSVRQAHFADSIALLLGELDDQGAEVVLFPETCGTEPVVRALEEALQANFKRTHGKPKIRLAFIGQLSERRNEAVVFSGAGQKLFTQQKLQPWQLDDRQQERYGLLDDLKGPEDQAIRRDEDLLQTAPQITILDEGGFGRFMILICEDMARCKPARAITVDLGPTFIVAPVMDASLARHRWSYEASKELAKEPGAIVAVVNSSVLTLRAHRVSNDTSQAPPTIGSLYHPDYVSMQTLIKNSQDLVQVPITASYALLKVPL